MIAATASHQEPKRSQKIPENKISKDSKRSQNIRSQKIPKDPQRYEKISKDPKR
jgi:hypothetical protein